MKFTETTLFIIKTQRKMKRIFILLFTAFVTTMLYAEIPPYIECNAAPNFLHSRYKTCHQPVVLKMQSSSTLFIDISSLPDMKKIKETGSSTNLEIRDITEKMEGKTDDATFEIKVDPDSVYDNSYKIYSAQFKNFSIKYTTYFEADKLSIVLKNKEYTLSCIDGGMDVHIKYLLHKYTPKRDGEKLSISVTGDLPLVAADKSKILLKKGSYIIFDIENAQHK